LLEKDKHSNGLVPHDEFIRCLSLSNMKCTEREVAKLVEELDRENSGLVNYNEFLKFSYLC
jgi:Ca2+-binding EF-hand superfamily protein